MTLQERALGVATVGVLGVGVVSAAFRGVPGDPLARALSAPIPDAISVAPEAAGADEIEPEVLGVVLVNEDLDERPVVVADRLEPIEVRPLVSAARAPAPAPVPLPTPFAAPARAIGAAMARSVGAEPPTTGGASSASTPVVRPAPFRPTPAPARPAGGGAGSPARTAPPAAAPATARATGSPSPTTGADAPAAPPATTPPEVAAVTVVLADAVPEEVQAQTDRQWPSAPTRPAQDMPPAPAPAPAPVVEIIEAVVVEAPPATAPPVEVAPLP